MTDITPPSAQEPDPLDRIPAALVRRGVDFVAIGGWAVRAQRHRLGRVTYDMDFTPARTRENLQRLSAALQDLGAQVQFGDESLPFSHDAESLTRATIWNLRCDAGDFDICFQPAGIDGGYDELSRAAHTVTIEVDGEPLPVRCADLADIVRSKQAADRFKDRGDLEILVPQLREREARRRGGRGPA